MLLKTDHMHFWLKHRLRSLWRLTLLPVEIFKRRGVGPLPASIDVQVIEAHPQGSTVAGQETWNSNNTFLKSQKTRSEEIVSDISVCREIQNKLSDVLPPRSNNMLTMF